MKVIFDRQLIKRVKVKIHVPSAFFLEPDNQRGPRVGSMTEHTCFQQSLNDLFNLKFMWKRIMILVHICELMECYDHAHHMTMVVHGQVQKSAYVCPKPPTNEYELTGMPSLGIIWHYIVQ